MLALIPALLPSLINVAEGVFSSAPGAAPGAGQSKKNFVIDAIDKLYDFLQSRGDVPKWLDKQLCLGLCSILIDKLVPELTK